MRAQKEPPHTKLPVGMRLTTSLLSRGDKISYCTTVFGGESSRWLRKSIQMETKQTSWIAKKFIVKQEKKILCAFKRGQIFFLEFFFSLCFTKVLQLENFFFFFFQSCKSSIQHLARDLFGGHLQEKKRDSRRSKWSSIDTAGPASLFSALLFGSQYLSLPAGLRKSHYRRTEELGNYWSKSQTHLEHLVISCEKDGRAGVCERTCASM